MARTRAADFAEKQRSILSHAATVFATLGMEKASMAQIASQCGVSKALLYHYYASKDALIFDIIRTHLEELDSALAQTEIKTADDPPEERLRKLVHQVLECYRDADDEHKVQLNCAALLPPEQAKAINVLERSIVRRMSNAIYAINPKIEEKRPLLKPVTMSLFGILNWAYMWFRADGPISREEYSDIATTLVLEGIKAIR
jgi:AcrR family transcriptional regulator